MNNYAEKRLFENWFIPDYSKPIGRGSFGVVYELRSMDAKSVHTAVKIISIPRNNDEYVERVKEFGVSVESVEAEYERAKDSVISEVELMLKVSGYTNCVGCTAYRVVEHEDCFGWDILIQMEMLESLDSYYRKKGAITTHDIVRLGIDMCRALEACEEHSIIHRDIKPANIMVKSVLDENGVEKRAHYKLGDFGVARVLSGSGTMTVSGTFEYMAPELFVGEEGDLRVDIYSLGMVMYQLLNANRLPFLPDYPQPITDNCKREATKRRMTGEKKPAPLYVAGTEIADVVLKACAHKKEDRFSSPTEMRVALEKALAKVEESTIFSVPPVGKYMPSERKFVLKISGNTDSVVYDGKTHAVEGFTTNAKDHNIEVALKPGVKAMASQTKPGRSDMGLTEDSFLVVSHEDGLQISCVLVNDGYIEVRGAAPEKKESDAVRPQKPKKEKKKRIWLPVLVAVLVLVAAAVLIFKPSSPKKASSKSTIVEEEFTFNRTLALPQASETDAFDIRLVDTWSYGKKEDVGERPAGLLPGYDYTIYADGTLAEGTGIVPEKVVAVITTENGKLLGLDEKFSVTYEIVDNEIAPEEYQTIRAAKRFFKDMPDDELRIHITGMIKEGPTTSYTVDTTYTFYRKYRMDSWLNHQMLGTWDDSMGNTWTFEMDENNALAFSMVDEEGTFYRGIKMSSSDYNNSVRFSLNLPDAESEEIIYTPYYNVDYFDRNRLELTARDGQTLTMTKVVSTPTVESVEASADEFKSPSDAENGVENLQTNQSETEDVLPAQQGELRVLDYRVTEGYSLKEVSCDISGEMTNIHIVWGNNPDVTTTHVAKWKAQDFTQQDIEDTKKIIVPIWNSDVPPSAVIETRVAVGIHYVPGSDFYVLLLGLNSQGEVCAEIVVKLGYPTV